LSVGSDSLRRARRRKAWPCGPPPPAAAGLTAPSPAAVRSTIRSMNYCRPTPLPALCDISIGEKL
jgi:hypothetical protein